MCGRIIEVLTGITNRATIAIPRNMAETEIVTQGQGKEDETQETVTLGIEEIVAEDIGRIDVDSYLVEIVNILDEPIRASKVTLNTLV